MIHSDKKFNRFSKEKTIRLIRVNIHSSIVSIVQIIDQLNFIFFSNSDC